MTITDGWLYHVSPYTANLFDADPIAFEYGIILPSEEGVSDIPQQNQIREKSIYGQYYATLENGPTYCDQIKLAFVPVNGIFLYWFFGKVTGTSTSRTVTHMDGLTRKPRITMFQQTGTLKYVTYGAVFGSLNITWQNQTLTVSLMGKALKHIIDLSDPTFTFPKTPGAVAVKTIYTDMNTMTWNSSALNCDKLSLQATQSLIPFPGSDGNYQEISEFAPIFGAYAVQCTAASGEALQTDFDAQTPRTFVWKIRKSDDITKYLQFSSTCTIKDLTSTRDVNHTQIWTAVLTSGAITCTIVDGLDGPAYDQAAE